MKIFRLTRAKYQDSAFSGYGGIQSAGRWHQAGLPVVYASDTPAGAHLMGLTCSFLLQTLRIDGPSHRRLRVILNALPDDYAEVEAILPPAQMVAAEAIDHSFGMVDPP